MIQCRPRAKLRDHGSSVFFSHYTNQRIDKGEAIVYQTDYLYSKYVPVGDAKYLPGLFYPRRYFDDGIKPISRHSV